MMDKVEVEYIVGRFGYKSTLIKTKYFCMFCGAANVWEDTDGWDYYAGERLCCGSCGGEFHDACSRDDSDVGKALKAKLTDAGREGGE